MVLAAGYTLDGLWRIVERSIVWHTVRMVLDQAGIGIAALAVVLLFVWKAYPVVKRMSRSRSEAKD